MIRPIFVAILLVSILAGMGVVQAHHSITANFDTSREVEIRGTVVDFNYVSPHASMVIDGIAYENGEPLSDQEQRWEIESSAVKGLAGRGIMADTFQPGDRIMVRGAPHRNSELHRANSSTFLAIDGSALNFDTPVRPGPVVVPDVEGAYQVAGRWRPPFQPNGEHSALPLNSAGLAAWDAYIQTDSPANTCEPMSIPVVMNAPGYYVDIRFGDEQVVIRNEAYDLHRTVRFADGFAPVGDQQELGSARGSIDGNQLVVESQGFPPSRWGLGAATQVNGGGADVPSSADKEIVERFSVSDDGLELYYDYTLFDPAYMSEAHTARVVLTRVADDAPMVAYDCDPASARQFSRAAGETVLTPN